MSCGGCFQMSLLDEHTSPINQDVRTYYRYLTSI